MKGRNDNFISSDFSIYSGASSDEAQYLACGRERKKELMAQNRVSDGMMFKLDWDPGIIGNKIVDGKQT